MEQTALSQAIKAAGGPKALGRTIGISSQAISQWDECPPRRVLAVEAASGIPRHELRPDLYPPPPANTELLAAGSVGAAA